MKYELPKKIKELKPYIPITQVYDIRMDANEGCFPIPENILEDFKKELEAFDFNRYPDPYGKEVCKGFASFYNVRAEDVVLGNGSDELISLIISGMLDSSCKVLSFTPDFSMYKFYCDVNGIENIFYDKPCDLEDFNDEYILKALKETQANVLIFSNPCNPTSFGITKKEIENVLKNTEALVILDEAYMDFWDESFIPFYKNYDNLIILKTASKGFGFANIRLGFLINNGAYIDTIKSIKSPYNVNGVTQLLGEIIFRNSDTIKKGIEEIRESRDHLYNSLKDMFPLLSPRGNFLYIPTDKSQDIRNHLLNDNISVKALANHLRVTVGRKNENQAFLTSIKKYMEENNA